MPYDSWSEPLTTVCAIVGGFVMALAMYLLLR
jgi:hypothetical protein